MSNNTLFQIRNLACAYDAGKIILRINELDIPKGELVFLLGVSGAGKSTLLETLALMNNTLAAGEVDFLGAEHTIGFSELWRKNNPEEIADIRKGHFSFIFQETNLMENFTAYENICLSKMIKQNIRQGEVVEGARQLANQVGLSEQELNAETLAVNLSGGQRQRLAFVRAINNDFTVVFGDEPTGNLDEENGNELLRILKANLGDESAAIIVSHDIDLALKHADRIIIITKSGKEYGEILPENIFAKADWETNRGFRDTLSDLYRTTKSPKKPDLVTQTTASNDTYSGLFFKKEGRALAGKNSINFWILTTILFLTFLVMGFANGSLNYLNQKMNNAFVKWMDISVPWGESMNAGNIRDRLATAELSSEFDYENVSAYVRYPFRFWNSNGKKTTRVKGRSVRMVDNRNPLLEEVLEDKNRLYGDREPLPDNSDMSLIVTKRFLTNLGLPENSAFVDMEFSIADVNTGEPMSLKVPIPIRAVVKEIPGRNSIIYTLDFYTTNSYKVGSTFDLRNSKNINVFAAGNRDNAERVLKAIGDFFEQHKEYETTDPRCEIREKHTMSHAEGYDIAITFFPPLYGTDADAIWSAIQNDSKIQNTIRDTKRVYYYEAKQENETTSYDRISLYFNDLNKVRPFADALYYNPERLGASKPIQVDIAQIKEKENFNFLSKVTKIVAWLLVGFGAISISLFIFNLLKMHLSKVKMNIGTLKAFGLNNDEAQNIYFRIILKFLAGSLVLALIITMLLGYLVDLFLGNRLIGEEGVSYFNLFHHNTLITVIILILVTILVSRFTIRNMLSKSPGDLIYGR